MDLLGSIMSNMTKKPGMSDKEKEKRKREREMATKLEEKQNQAKKKFRAEIEKRIDDFIKDPQEKSLKLEPMEKFFRSIAHDVAEVAGLVAHSFGEEDVDRHIRVWKKEWQPGEDELNWLRAGKEWDQQAFEAEKAARLAREAEEAAEAASRRKRDKFVPKQGNYSSKYEHLIGNDEVIKVDSADKKSYGMVSADQKKDKRTVEDIQAEIRAKKRMKTADAAPEAE